ncbi:hypothetical protein PsYK624_098300 [Phanerochaete sordida]|uniref:Uncharacterized protein n=1 Tax=Phanerochaete sordida TaxID=48140 RepID=A0A9P3LFV8_9APHY|nr:hypothetical protein PsYK624_098300 [Phanerochaete sordida]
MKRSDYASFVPQEPNRSLNHAVEAVQSIGQRIAVRLPNLVMNSVLFGALSMLIPLLVLVLVNFTNSRRIRAVAGSTCLLIYGVAAWQWGFEIYALVVNLLGSNEVKTATAQCLHQIAMKGECTLGRANQLLGPRLTTFLSLANILNVGNAVTTILGCYVAKDVRHQLITVGGFVITAIVASVLNNNPNASLAYSRAALGFELAFPLILSCALSIWTSLLIIRSTRPARSQVVDSYGPLLGKLQIALAVLQSSIWVVLAIGVLFARWAGRSFALESIRYYVSKGIHLFFTSGFLYVVGIYVVMQFMLIALTESHAKDYLPVSLPEGEDAEDREPGPSHVE